MKNFINMFKKHQGLKTDEYIEDNYEYDYDEKSKSKPKKSKKETYSNPKDYEYNYATISDDDYYNISKNKKNKLLKIYLIVLTVLITLIITDTVLVSKFDIGPFFAIRTKVHDEGTKEYHGLGYKVIKYNQDNGRVDTVIGLWDIDYKGTPTTLTMTEIALDLVNNQEETYKELSNQYIELNSEITKMDIEEKVLVFHYTNDESKYDLAVYCNLTDKEILLSQYNENQNLTYNGIVDSYKENKDSINELVLKNCNIKSE